MCEGEGDSLLTISNTQYVVLNRYMHAISIEFFLHVTVCQYLFFVYFVIHPACKKYMFSLFKCYLLIFHFCYLCLIRIICLKINTCIYFTITRSVCLFEI